MSPTTESNVINTAVAPPAGDEKDIKIRKISDDLWSFAGPFDLGLFRMGNRSIAIRLPLLETDRPATPNKVVLFPSTPVTPLSQKTVDDLGQVKYIVAADKDHSLFLKPWKDIYQDAKIIGVKGHKEKEAAAKVTFNYVYGHDEGKSPLEADPHVQQVLQFEYFSGYKKKDLAIFHKPTGTLFEYDLLFNLPARECYKDTNKKPGMLGLAGLLMKPSSWFHRFVQTYVMCENKLDYARSAKVVDSWQIKRILPCHGDEIVDQNGDQAASKAWKALFGKFLKLNTDGGRSGENQ